ncbi:MAG: 4-hydroxy-tetrahydrodipicolinate synthase [Elusimicrobia bacterium]|nr:MAG: 4-hydroxy-tetrahydrodipicolinate synthase [Elusimicrobiota bacterium]
MRFAGTFTALITPFKNGAVDEKALRKLIRFQIRSGISGLVPCGSTGEAAALDPDEYQRVIEITVEEARGKVPVVPGVGTNGTAKTITQTKAVEKLGVDGLLVIVPYYNKPTQDGLYNHFAAVAKAVKLPIVVYNIPGRTAINLAPDTLARLAKKYSNIVATKEASGSLDQVAEVLSKCPYEFTVLAGDDGLVVPMMSIGARGVISVTSNLYPRAMSKMTAAALQDDFRTARRLHAKIFPVVKALFLETNPIPIKDAMKTAGYGDGKPRLPLLPLTAPSRKKMRAVLKATKF